MEATVHGGRLIGHVTGANLIVVPRVDGTLTVHHGPKIEPGLEALAQQGGGRIVALIRAGYGSAAASTGDRGLDRLVTAGGGHIIALAPRAPLPPAIGWLRWHRGRRCGRFLAGAIAAVPVLAFREPEGAWIVYRKAGEVASGAPSSRAEHGLTLEALSAAQGGAVEAEVLTGASRKVRHSPAEATP